MSFKPKSENNNTRSREINGKPLKFPTPEAGNQVARVSLIVDMGTQEREDFEDPKTGETRPQKPCQQIFVAVDLVDNVVDYGGEIGEAHYRLPLNKVYAGELDGINFTAVPPRDADGNMVKGKLWTFHPASVLTKLAKATGKENILGKNESDNMDISQLLGEALSVDVEVVERDSGKKDSDGNPIIYSNVKYKSLSTVPKMKGKMIDVDPLRVEPLLITFDNVSPETAKFLRRDVRAKIMRAPEYRGSKMEEVLSKLYGEKGAPVEKEESFDSDKLGSVGEDYSEPSSDFDDDDIPF